MAIVGKPVDDEDLITCIISGLNPLYHVFISSYSFATCHSSLTFDEFQTELLNYEMLFNNHNSGSNQDASSFALYCHKKVENGPYKPQQQNGHPSKQHSNQTNQPTKSTTFHPHKPSNSGFALEHRAPCQIRGKSGHQALDCFNRMNFS